jgi:hypothetical protein
MSKVLDRVLMEEVIFVVGGGTDAPGFKLVPDGHGGFKIVPVPGWNPEAGLELSSALKVMGLAARLKNPEGSRAILHDAAKIVEKELGPAIGAHGGGKVVVVFG